MREEREDMQYDQEREDEELIWWVRYSLKPELVARSQRPPEQFSAFFYARDEAARDKKIAGWRHYIHHDQIVLDAIEQVSEVPYDLPIRLGWAIGRGVPGEPAQLLRRAEAGRDEAVSRLCEPAPLSHAPSLPSVSLESARKQS